MSFYNRLQIKRLYTIGVHKHSKVDANIYNTHQLIMFFKKRKKEFQVNDQVWLSKVAKFRGLYDYLESCLQSGDMVVVINHFENTQNEITQMAEKLGVAHQVIQLPSTQVQSVTTFVSKTETLLETTVQSPVIQRLINEPILKIIVPEHHPAYSQEQTLLLHLMPLIPHAQISFFTSLDEPFMKILGNSRITTVLQRMGIQEDENIEHSLVTKSIARTQQKIEKKAAKKIIANSQQEWLELSGITS